MGEKKPEVIMEDLIGRPLNVGDIVAARIAGTNELKLATVMKLAKKQIKVEYADPHNWRSRNGRREGYVAPHNTAKLEGPDLTLFLLRKD